MKVSHEQMIETHARILESAGRRFRRGGIAGSSVSDVMGEAGLTHGGFYRHFDSKDELAAAAIRFAFDSFLRQFASEPNEGNREAGERFRAMYLSAAHAQNPEDGCPIPALGSEIRRENPVVRDAFRQGIEATLGQICQVMDGSPHERQRAAARELSMLVGALVLARATGGELGELVLESCRAKESS